MAKLNKVQKCYIEVNAGNLTNKVIAKDLGITEQTVEKYIQRNTKNSETVETEPVNVIETSTVNPETFKVDKLQFFARRKGSVAMTAAGSEAGDENRKKMPSMPPMRDGIRKFREDD